MAYSSEEQNNINTIRRMNGFVNSENYDAMDDLFKADYVDHNPGFKVNSLEDLKNLLRDAHRNFDIRNVLNEVFASGEFVVARVTTNGKFIAETFGKKPDGRPLILEMMEIYRFRDGKIAERWVASDVAGMMKQVGVKLPF